MNHLIKRLTLMACLLTPQLACHGMQRAGEAKPPADDVQKKQQEELILGLRNILYCDEPLDEILDRFVDEDDPVHGAVAHLRAKDYARALATLRGLKGHGESSSYWLALAAAYRGQGKLEEARDAARHLASDTESRVLAQAWTVLRELGEAPPPQKADEVLGVVVEMGYDQGVAIIAGYADGRARFFGSTGAGYIGEGLPEPVQKAARALTQEAAPVVRKLNPGARRGYPTRDRVRITVLTPAGLRVADEESRRLEESAHPLSGVYLAANKLFLELKNNSEKK
ncbi:MAG TPA: hypothetical protein VGB98_16170 [Pyrinomonadaceae bacterium]